MRQNVALCGNGLKAKQAVSIDHSSECLCSYSTKFSKFRVTQFLVC